jgi:hypothetical protein
MAHDWDARRHLPFADARTLPAIDLLSRIELAAPTAQFSRYSLELGIRSGLVKPVSGNLFAKCSSRDGPASGSASG